MASIVKQIWNSLAAMPQAMCAKFKEGVQDAMSHAVAQHKTAAEALAQSTATCVTSLLNKGSQLQGNVVAGVASKLWQTAGPQAVSAQKQEKHKQCVPSPGGEGADADGSVGNAHTHAATSGDGVVGLSVKEGLRLLHDLAVL